MFINRYTQSPYAFKNKIRYNKTIFTGDNILCLYLVHHPTRPGLLVQVLPGLTWWPGELWLYMAPIPVTMTTRIIICLVGDSGFQPKQPKPSQSPLLQGGGHIQGIVSFIYKLSTNGWLVDGKCWLVGTNHPHLVAHMLVFFSRENGHPLLMQAHH